MKKFRGIQKYNLAITPVVLFLILISGYSYAYDISSIPYNDSNDKTQILPIVSTGSQVYYPSGTYYFLETDLRVSSRSIPMVWERTYRSNRVLKKNNQWVFGEPADGPLGFGWMTPWFVRIEGDAFVNEEGRYFYFQKDANGNYLPNMEAGFVLKKIASGHELIEIGANTYTFNVTGKLTSIKDQRGNTATLNYDTEGKLTSIKDVMNRHIFTFTYNAQAKISQITDIAGRTINYEYDAIGNLIKVTHGDEIIATYTYNTYHGITSKTNALSETYTIEYYPTWIDKGVAKRIIDPIGTELIKQGKEPTGHEMTFIYDFQNRVFYYTDYRGITYKNIMNEKGQILSTDEIQNGQAVPMTKVEYLENRTVKTTDALSNVTLTQKDEWGNIIKRIDPEGNEWRYTYNIQSKLLSITDPMGTITKYEYDSYGNRTKEILASGTAEESTTVYTYNQYNELTAITKGTATTSYTYNNTGNLTELKDPVGNTTTMTYDDAGNLLSLTDSAGNKTEFTYDGNGNRLTHKDPLGNITKYEYNSANRITKFTDAPGNTTLYETDFKGRITAITDALNNKKEYQYDGSGNIIKIIEGSITTTMTYDSSNRLTSLTDAEESVTKYEYAGAGCSTCGGNAGSLNNPVKMIDPLGNAAYYIYDKAGRLIGERDRNGNYITYSYDPLGRLIKGTYPDGTTTTYAYDKLGRLLNALNENTTLTYAYDQYGNITSYTDSRTGKTITYEYDLNGRRTKMTYPEGGTTTYAYNALNLLSSITNPSGKLFNFTYDALGRRTGLTYPIDINTTYAYNGASRITEMVNKLDTTQITKNLYSYDNVGNRLTNTDLKGTHSYQYDSLYQLIKAIHPDIETEAFTYDKVGNRITETRGQTTINYTHASGNRVQTKNGETYTHDKNGNIITKTDATGTTTYEYDYENRLRKVTMPDGTIAEYKYDALWRRIEKAATSNGTITTIRYLYDGVNIVAEYGENNNLKTKYTHNLTVDDPLAMERNGKTYYYHKDALGSITAITDFSGTIVQSYEYDSFGNITYTKDPSFIQPYAFTGREYDTETKLYYYRARYYDAKIGRFISEDPIGLLGGINLYVYVGNNPINLTDPFGLSPCEDNCKEFRWKCKALAFTGGVACNTACTAACIWATGGTGVLFCRTTCAATCAFGTGTLYTYCDRTYEECMGKCKDCKK